MDNIEILIEEILHGDRDRYEIIIDHFQKKLYKYIYHMIGDIHEAEDILQNVFIKAYRSLSSYRVSISFSAWLYKIAYNESINAIRKKSLIKFVDLFDFNKIRNDDKSELQENLEFDESIEKTLGSLKVEERSLLMLRIFEERSYDELSVIFDKSPSALRKKYERAKKKFGKIYMKIGGAKYEECANGI